MTYHQPSASHGFSSSPSLLPWALATSPTPPASSLTSPLALLLVQTEAAVDQAYALAGHLAASLTDARRARGLSAVVGQPVYDHAARSLTSLGTARGEIVSVHRLLETLAKRLGIDVSAYGDSDEKPPSGMLDDANVLRAPVA